MTAQTTLQRDAARLNDQMRVDHLDLSTEAPGGYPSEIEAAIIDSVCSVRTNYGQPNNGVRAHVKAWRTERAPAPIDDVRALLDFSRWNSSRKDHKLAQAIAGRPKADIIVDVAQRLSSAGIVTSKQLLADPDHARTQWFDTPGLAFATWQYVLLLLGYPTSKPDTIVLRYLTKALKYPVGQQRAVDLIEEASAQLGEASVTPTTIDHAIWAHQRKLPVGG